MMLYMPRSAGALQTHLLHHDSYIHVFYDVALTCLIMHSLMQMPNMHESFTLESNFGVLGKEQAQSKQV